MLAELIEDCTGGGIVLVQRNKLRGKVSAKYTVHLAAQGGGEITHMLRN